MSQIVRRKKKGRPSKADLALRNSGKPPPSPARPCREPRRSLRVRSVRYTFDFDDYVDDDDKDVRREKKLKLLLKLQGNSNSAEEDHSQLTRRVAHAPASASSSDCDEEKPSKKRKIGGGDGLVAEDDADSDAEDGEEEDIKRPNGGAIGTGSVLDSPSDRGSGTPLPDKKTLELILDKLQKKDIYGVYAEPVDPEELPDYHDVIKHPMDFATVRKKLSKRAYSTLEQLESDVFLICTNAMEYNAQDTVYYRQANSILELAKRKFSRIRVNAERCETEVKSEEKTASSLLLSKKHVKMSSGRSMQEPVGSDFSSGATLATAGEIQNRMNAPLASTCERPTTIDGLVAESSFLMESNLDKAEESLTVRSSLSRFGRKNSLHDENRRATYNMSSSNQTTNASDSIFSTFEGEIKQLVPVGLQADHSYARSLALFTATLGSVAWRVASQRIEQALPTGSKFGRGWVCEYEPLPTPVLIVEKRQCLNNHVLPKRSQSTAGGREKEKAGKAKVSVEPQVNGPNSGKKSPFVGTSTSATCTQPTVKVLPERSQFTTDERERGKTGKTQISVELQGDGPSSGAEKSPLFCTSPSAVSNQPTVKEESPVAANLTVRPPFFSRPFDLVSPKFYQHNSPSMNLVEPNKKKHSNQVELNSNAAVFVSERQISTGSNVLASISAESVPRNRNLSPSVSFNRRTKNEVITGGLDSKKPASNGLDFDKVVPSPSSNYSNQRAEYYFPPRQEQGLSDPVQLMRMLAEKAQNQQKSSTASPSSIQQVVSHVPSPRGNDSKTAALASNRAWISIGPDGYKQNVDSKTTPANQISANSLYNPTLEYQRFRGEFPVQVLHFQQQPEIKNSFQVQNAFLQQPNRTSEARFQNRPTGFPQLATADLSSFQVQSTWRGVASPQAQPNQKPEMLPPDLNIGFQSVGSPAKQSLVDNQQPDLALQL